MGPSTPFVLFLSRPGWKDWCAAFVAPCPEPVWYLCVLVFCADCMSMCVCSHPLAWLFLPMPTMQNEPSSIPYVPHTEVPITPVTSYTLINGRVQPSPINVGVEDFSVDPDDTCVLLAVCSFSEKNSHLVDRFVPSKCTVCVVLCCAVGLGCVMLCYVLLSCVVFRVPGGGWVCRTASPLPGVPPRALWVPHWGWVFGHF